MRYFTLEEAEALIPELEKIFAYVLDLRAKAQSKARLVHDLEAASSADPVEVATQKAQLEFLANGMDDWLRRVAELGAVAKGLDPALVDFPFRLEGREVYLCWRLGEKFLTHYHGLEEGFTGRKRLPESVRS